MKNIEMLTIKMITNQRGRITWPFNELIEMDCDINNIHIPSVMPEAVRGKHAKHAFIIIKTGKKDDFLILDDEPTCFKIESGITHAFKNESASEIILFCYEQKSKNGLALYYLNILDKNSVVYHNLIFSEPYVLKRKLNGNMADRVIQETA